MEWTFWSLSSNFSAFSSVLDDDHDENISIWCCEIKTHIIEIFWSSSLLSLHLWLIQPDHSVYKLFSPSSASSPLPPLCFSIISMDRLSNLTDWDTIINSSAEASLDLFYGHCSRSWSQLHWGNQPNRLCVTNKSVQTENATIKMQTY